MRRRFPSSATAPTGSGITPVPCASSSGWSRRKSSSSLIWYHVESGIWTLSTLPTKWSKHRQISWRNRALAHLHDGEIDALIEQLGELDVPSEKAEDHHDVPRKDFFTKNGERLRYDQARAANLPEGSGAIESVIRRVVNLRLKGSSKYWTEENAAHTMFLRAQLRTGRFDSFMRWARAQQAVWWTQADRSRLRMVENASKRNSGSGVSHPLSAPALHFGAFI